jgi:hypothetical protein
MYQLLKLRGDLPLWGAALALVDHPVAFLKLPYYHGSHNYSFDSKSKSRNYGLELRSALVYADHIHTYKDGKVMNTRIDVKDHQGMDFTHEQKITNKYLTHHS